MKKLLFIMAISIIGCSNNHVMHPTRYFPITKTTSVVRCDKMDRCIKEIARHCSTPVEIDNGHSDKSGYWILYNCYTCRR